MFKEIFATISKNILMVVAAGVILVIALGWYNRYQQIPAIDIDEGQASRPLPQETVPGQIPKSGMLASVIDLIPQYEGEEVRIGFAILSKPGFAVIHENVAGKPGKVIGASQLLKAEEMLDEITVKAPVKRDVSYFAMLHIDNGNGVWNASEDPTFFDTNGEPVMVEFTVEAPEPEIPPLYPEGTEVQ